MKAAVLFLTLWLASPVCYHPEIFCAGGSHAVFKDDEAMTGRQAVGLSLGLVVFTGALAYFMPRIEARPVEPRLSGGAAYVPCRIDDDAADLIPDAVCGRRPRPSSKAPGFPRATRGGAAPEAGGDVQEIPLGDLLADGRIEKLNTAVQRYERRTSANPHDAMGWSDLAAIYLVRAEKADNPRDLLRAYGAASRAVAEPGPQLEARFNKALALERLFLPDAARAGWKDYLDWDRTSGWADEARKRSRSLLRARAEGDWSGQEERLRRAALAGDSATVGTLVNQYRQPARELAEQRLFGEWGDAVVSGRKEPAEETLRILRAVGDALTRTSGEHLVKDSVAAVEEALSGGDTGRLRELARGARDFRDGYKEYSARSTEQAGLELAASREALTRAGSPLALRAAFYLVSNDYVARRYPEAAAGAARLALQIGKLPYGALRGHVYWIKGMAEATLGKTREAIDDLQRSFDEFKRLGETENAANIDCRLGEVLTSRGRKGEAWRIIYRALRNTPRLRDPVQVATVYMIAGNAALQDGLDDAALVFQEERVRQSRLNQDNYLAQVEALTWLARFQHHLGDDAGARASLNEAGRLVSKVEEKQRPRRRADLAMIEGMVIEDENPRQAADLLTSALPIYEEEKNVVFSLWTLLARGRAYRQAGNDDLAERDFEGALALYDRMGEKLGTEDLRLALLEETDSVFDEMVDLQAGRNPERAFAYADRARTRVLPGSASKLWTGLPGETSRLLAAEPQTLHLNEIRRRLPEKVTLVQFSVLPDRVLIWTLRRGGKGEGFFQAKIDRGALEDRVSRLQAFDAKGWGEVSGSLFDDLIRPWLATVPAGERIVFIPDKVLHRVPFGVLRNGSRWLIETHPVAIAPSATLYVNALERRDSRPPDPARGLVVGEPAIDRNLAGNETLSSLPAAAAEARRIARQTGSRLLEGPAASKAAFLAAAPGAEWIQFSGHAVIDPSNTLLSKLVLAPGRDGDPGALTAREIYSQKLGGTRLVVLAACDTGNEYVPGGEGITSLARAFLAAGVPTVVASLWSVDDEATAQLFKVFHRNLLAGGDPVEALRAAQLEMLRSPDKKYRSPGAWAAFEVIGASAGGQP